jgi:hypothetical protein
MNIECPHCKVDFNSEDIAHTLKNGNYICPVCEKKISSPSSDDKQSSSVSFVSQKKYVIPALIILVLVAASAFILFSKSPDETTGMVIPVDSKITEPLSNPSPAPVSTPSDTPAPQETIPASQETQAPQVSQKPDKMQIVERIAAMYHATHSYTMEGGFVCLDMAIDVWNQLKTNGVEAKIMGGNIRENITAWNYRQLAMEGNHAWVVATISPNEKVAIETTMGKVIKQGTTDVAPYFKGIAFDDPAQVKRFEQLRKLVAGNCRDATNLINDFNKDAAEKQLRPEEIIARKSQIEQRKQDCEGAFNRLKEFESKAIFY